MTVSDEVYFKALSGVTTATLTTILLKKGLRNVWIRGAFPLAQGLDRIVGRAFTVRFVPAREDLATPESWSSPKSSRGAIEQMPSGCIAVVDAMGVKDAGIWGDILCARMAKRGVAGLVTDGVVRDLAGVLGTKLPVWASGAAAPWSRSAPSRRGCRCRRAPGVHRWRARRARRSSGGGRPRGSGR